MIEKCVACGKKTNKKKTLIKWLFSSNGVYCTCCYKKLFPELNVVVLSNPYKKRLRRLVFKNFKHGEKKGLYPINKKEVV